MVCSNLLFWAKLHLAQAVVCAISFFSFLILNLLWPMDLKGLIITSSTLLLFFFFYNEFRVGAITASILIPYNTLLEYSLEGVDFLIKTIPNMNTYVIGISPIIISTGNTGLLSSSCRLTWDLLWNTKMMNIQLFTFAFENTQALVLEMI